MALNNLYNQNPLAYEKQLQGCVNDRQLSHDSETTSDFMELTSRVRTNKLLDAGRAASLLQHTCRVLKCCSLWLTSSMLMLLFLYPCHSTNQCNRSGVCESASGTLWNEFKMNMKLVSYYEIRSRSLSSRSSR